MTRFLTISVFGSETIAYSIPKKEFSDSIVDKSHFIPVSELSKTVQGNISSTDLNNYDFANGIDDGRPFPRARKKGIDLAELDRIAKDNIDIANQALKEKQKYENDVAKFSNKPTVSASSAVDSAE